MDVVELVSWAWPHALGITAVGVAAVVGWDIISRLND